MVWCLGAASDRKVALSAQGLVQELALELAPVWVLGLVLELVRVWALGLVLESVLGSVLEFRQAHSHR